MPHRQLQGLRRAQSVNSSHCPILRNHRASERCHQPCCRPAGIKLTQQTACTTQKEQKADKLCRTMQSVPAGPAVHRYLTVQWLSATTCDILSQPLDMVEAAIMLLRTSSAHDPSIIAELAGKGALQRSLQQISGATAQLQECDCSVGKHSDSCPNRKYATYSEVLRVLCSNGIPIQPVDEASASSKQAWHISTSATAVLIQSEQLQQLLMMLPIVPEIAGPLLQAVAQTAAGCKVIADGGHLAVLTASASAEFWTSLSATAGILQCLAKSAYGAAALVEQQQLSFVVEAVRKLTLGDPLCSMLQQLFTHQSAVQILLQQSCLNELCTMSLDYSCGMDVLASLLAHEAAVEQFVQMGDADIEISIKSLIESLKATNEEFTSRKLKVWYDRRRFRASRLLGAVVRFKAGQVALATQENQLLLLDAITTYPSRLLEQEHARAVIANIAQHKECRRAMRWHIKGRLAIDYRTEKSNCEQLLQAIDAIGRQQQQQQQPPVGAAVPTEGGMVAQPVRQQQQQQQQDMANAGVPAEGAVVAQPAQQCSSSRTRKRKRSML